MLCASTSTKSQKKRRHDITGYTVWEEEERGYRSKRTIVPVHMWQKCKEKHQNIRPEDHNQPTSYWEGTRNHNRHTHESHKPGLSPTCVTLEASNAEREREEDWEKEWQASLESHTGCMCHRQQHIWKVGPSFFLKKTNVTFHQLDRSRLTATTPTVKHIYDRKAELTEFIFFFNMI